MNIIYILVLGTCLSSYSAYAEEVAKSDGSTATSTQAGVCVLSVQNLFKRLTPGSEVMPVVPLATAKVDPSCPKLLDYTDVEKAYSLLPQQQGEQHKVAMTGAVFSRSFAIPEFGEAYSDPSGLIWSAPESSRMRNFKRAQDHCKQIGGRVPTVEEFQQLAGYLGLGKPGSTPYLADGTTEVIPGIAGKKAYWTSTPSNSIPHWHRFFDMSKPDEKAVIADSGAQLIRCVTRL